MLFKPYHVWPILTDDPAIKKILTHRLWDRKHHPSQRKARAKVGAIHTARLGYSNHSIFARLRILDVRQVRVGDINETDAHQEGGYSLEEYLLTLDTINRCRFDPDEMLFRIEFEREPDVQISIMGAGNPFLFPGVTKAEATFYEAAYWRHMAEIRKALLRRRP